MSDLRLNENKFKNAYNEAAGIDAPAGGLTSLEFKTLVNNIAKDDTFNTNQLKSFLDKMGVKDAGDIARQMTMDGDVKVSDVKRHFDAAFKDDNYMSQSEFKTGLGKLVAENSVKPIDLGKKSGIDKAMDFQEFKETTALAGVKVSDDKLRMVFDELSKGGDKIPMDVLTGSDAFGKGELTPAEFRKGFDAVMRRAEVVGVGDKAGVDKAFDPEEFKLLTEKMGITDQKKVDAVFDSLKGDDGKISLENLYEAGFKEEMRPQDFQKVFNKLATEASRINIEGDAGIDKQVDSQEFGKILEKLGVKASPENIEKAFKELAGENGKIPFEDLVGPDGFGRADLTPKEAQKAFDKIIGRADSIDIMRDAGINKRVDQEELKAMLEKAGVKIDDETFDAVFEHLAKGSDQIDAKDLMEALGGKESLTPAQFRKAFDKLVDEALPIRFDAKTTGADMQLDLQEFMKLAREKGGVDLDDETLGDIFDHIRGDNKKITKDDFESAFGGTRLTKQSFADEISRLAEEVSKVDLNDFMTTRGDQRGMNFGGLNDLLSAIGHDSVSDKEAEDISGIDKFIDTSELKIATKVDNLDEKVRKSDLRDAFGSLFGSNT